MPHLRVSHVFCLCPLVLLLAVSVAVAQAPAPAPLALVNGKPVTGESFQQEVMGNWAARVLDDVIRRRVVWDEATRLKLVVTRPELEARLKVLKQPYASEAAFQEMLRGTGETQEHFLERVKTDMLLDKIVAHRGQVSDADLQAYYAKHKASYVHPPRVHLFDLVTTEVEAAYTARRRISDGEEFAAVAKEMSVGANAAQGGDLGMVRADQLPAGLMRATAFSLEAGQVSNPLLIDGQYHILYVSEAEKGSSRTLEEVKPEILAAVKEERGLTRGAVLESLLRAATIQVQWDPLRYLNAQYARLKQPQLVVDGKTVTLALPARMEQGSLLMTVKPLAIALGATTSWEPRTMTLTLKKGERSVALTIGKPVMKVGGENVPVVPPRFESNLTVAEPRPIVEGLGGSVRWDPVRNTLFVKSVAEVPEAPEMPEPTPEPSPAAPVAEG